MDLKFKELNEVLELQGQELLNLLAQ